MTFKAHHLKVSHGLVFEPQVAKGVSIDWCHENIVEEGGNVRGKGDSFRAEHTQDDKKIVAQV